MLTLFFLLLPLLFMVWFSFYARRSSARQGGYMEKASIHMVQNTESMARMEAKTDRMIALLESIDRKLGQGNYRESSEAPPRSESGEAPHR